MTLDELLELDQAGRVTFTGDKQKIKQQSTQALDRLAKGNPGFNCKKCGAWFQPTPKQWIFHELCATCFAAFDRQKMEGRLALMVEKKKMQYFEDSDEWVQQTKKRT